MDETKKQFIFELLPKILYVIILFVGFKILGPMPWSYSLRTTVGLIFAIPSAILLGPSIKMILLKIINKIF
jgi:hypothetical protein